MRPLLTIAIPTYNRPVDLGHLHSEFLKPAINAFPDLLDVVVCDNSDEAEANKNAALLQPPIRHLTNPHNIGFAGNLLRCVAEARGIFLWIVSDDDRVDMTGFCQLISQLPQAAQDGVRGVMLPFWTVSSFGERRISDTHTDWAVGRDATLREIMASRRGLPFILFSSVVIRADGPSRPELIAELGKTFGGNHYLQIPLFLSLLRHDARVRFVETPLQTYRPEYRGRFDMEELASSLERVVEYAAEYGADREILANKYYRGWLILGLHHRLGLYAVEGADRFRTKLLRGLRKHPNPKNLVLGLALVLPARLAKWPYFLWQAQLEKRSGGNAGHGVFRSARELERRVAAFRQEAGR